MKEKHILCIPFCVWIVFHCMTRPHLVYPSPVDGHLVVFTFLLLWIRLLWTCVYKYLFQSLFSVLLGRYIAFHLYELSRVGKFMQSESRLEATRGQGEGSYCSMGTEYLLGMTKSFGITGDSCTTVYIWLIL